MTSVPDLTLLVYYGDGQEVEVKVPAEFTIDRAKKAILAKLPEFAGAQTSEYLLSIAGTFLTTEFSKLGTLEVVRENGAGQPIRVKLLRRIKIRGGIVSPRPGHIAWEPALQPRAFLGTPRRHSHSTETELSPVTEESFEHAEAQELRIELAQRHKLIAQQKLELDNLKTFNAELIRLLEAHNIPVPARSAASSAADDSKPTPASPKAVAADATTPKQPLIDRNEAGKGEKPQENSKDESSREEKEVKSNKQRKSDGGGANAAEVASPKSPKDTAAAASKKKQKNKEKDVKAVAATAEKKDEKKEKEKDAKRKKKFTWKSAGKKQGAAMKDALIRGDLAEAEGEQHNTQPVDTGEKLRESIEESNEDGSGASTPTRKRDSGMLEPGGGVTPIKAKTTPPQTHSPVAASPPPTRNAHSPLLASLASEDSRGKRNSLSNIWRKGKKDKDSTGSGIRERRSESASGATEAMPFPGIRFHQNASSLEDLKADDETVDATSSDVLTAVGGGSAASAVSAGVAEESPATREGRSGSGGGSGVFKRHSGKKKSGTRGSGIRLSRGENAASLDKEREAAVKEETAGASSEQTQTSPASSSEPIAAAESSARPAKRERSESANERRGTMAFYDIMRSGAEKLVDEQEQKKIEGEGEKNENGGEDGTAHKADENGEGEKSADDAEKQQEKEKDAETPAPAPEESGLNPADEEKKPEVKKPKLSPEEHAQKIREEFIKTEEKYTQNLDILLTRYMTPLRQAAAATNDEDKVVSIKEVEKVFSRELTLLQTMHSHLLKEITASTTSSEFIDAFFSFVPYLKTYTVYVNNFVNSNKALSELIKSNAKFQKFIQDTYERLNEEFVKKASEDKMSDNQTQVDLRGLLIMPIQRLPRYELLLRDLARHTAENEVEHAKLEKLLKDVQKVNQHINEAKRKDENTNKLVEIQNAIKTKGDKPFTLFDRVGRKFVREGKLEMRELHTDPAKKIPNFARHVRLVPVLVGYVFLFDDLLVLTKQEKGAADAPRTYVLVKAYPLSGYTASSHFEIASAEVEDKEKERLISLVPLEKEGRVIQLKAHSSTDRQNWLEDISKHIQHALQRVLGSTPPAGRKGSNV